MNSKNSLTHLVTKVEQVAAPATNALKKLLFKEFDLEKKYIMDTYNASISFLVLKKIAPDTLKNTRVKEQIFIPELARLIRQKSNLKEYVQNLRTHSPDFFKDISLTKLHPSPSHHFEEKIYTKEELAYFEHILTLIPESRQVFRHEYDHILIQKLPEAEALKKFTGLFDHSEKWFISDQRIQQNCKETLFHALSTGKNIKEQIAFLCTYTNVFSSMMHWPFDMTMDDFSNAFLSGFENTQDMLILKDNFETILSVVKDKSFFRSILFSSLKKKLQSLSAPCRVLYSEYTYSREATLQKIEKDLQSKYSAHPLTFSEEHMREIPLLKEYFEKLTFVNKEYFQDFFSDLLKEFYNRHNQRNEEEKETPKSFDLQDQEVRLLETLTRMGMGDLFLENLNYQSLVGILTKYDSLRKNPAFPKSNMQLPHTQIFKLYDHIAPFFPSHAPEAAHLTALLIKTLDIKKILPELTRERVEHFLKHDLAQYFPLFSLSAYDYGVAYDRDQAPKKISMEIQNIKRLLTLPDVSSSSISPEDMEMFIQKIATAPFYFFGSSYKESFTFDRLKNILRHTSRPEDAIKIIKAIATRSPQYFVKFAEREHWKLLFGEKILQDFLAVLPKATDEKRNAFTHNQYDRTSSFLEYQFKHHPEIALDSTEFKIIEQYIAQFGLSKTPVLFEYFRTLSLYEQGKIPQLPPHIAESGIHSSSLLKKRLDTLKKQVYGQEEIREVAHISGFEAEALSLLSGKSTHSFDEGRSSMERILEMFTANMEKGAIGELPPEAVPLRMNAPKVTISFDQESVREDITILGKELNESISYLKNTPLLKQKILSLLSKELTSITRSLSEKKKEEEEMQDKGTDTHSKQQKGLQFALNNLKKEKNELEHMIKSIQGTESLDLAISSLFDLKSTPEIRSLLREITFLKYLERVISEDEITQLQFALQSEQISAETVLKFINMIEHNIKDHILSIEKDNAEGYWDKTSWEKIKRNQKKSKMLQVQSLFNPYFGNLKKAVEEFDIKEDKEHSNEILMIPDRGLIGELSAYLANVCYSKEENLLLRYPNVIPYKFVSTPPGEGTEESSPEFIGSTLVFEVETANNEKALLIRGFNIPQDSTLNISSVIENFLHEMTLLAKKRGAKYVLFPGNTGAISNYGLTINHIRETYIQEKTPISLNKNFSFNGYDVTNHCYIARSIHE